MGTCRDRDSGRKKDSLFSSPYRYNQPSSLCINPLHIKHNASQNRGIDQSRHAWRILHGLISDTEFPFFRISRFLIKWGNRFSNRKGTTSKLYTQWKPHDKSCLTVKTSFCWFITCCYYFLCLLSLFLSCYYYYYCIPYVFVSKSHIHIV